MGISDAIARFILETLAASEGQAELQRAELAQRFGCVPSQINYVISTRFSPEHGYIVESRRGGGGYIRITRAVSPAQQLLMHMVNAVGEEIDLPSARAFLSNGLNANVLSPATVRLMEAAIGENALRSAPPPLRNRIRASIFKQMLLCAV